MKKLYFFSIIIFALLHSCIGDDYVDEIEPAYPVKLHIHHKAGTANFAFNTNYNHSGTTIQFTRASFYMSNMEFGSSNSNNLQPSERYLLIKPDISHYNLGTVTDTANFNSLYLHVGIDSITNVTREPSEYNIGEALAAQIPDSHYWTWNSGWVFLIMEGKVDTDMNGTYDNDPSEQFIFHIGLNKFYGYAHLMGNYSITSTVSNIIHMDVDYLKFLNNIDLKTENSTHSMGTIDKIALAQKVHDNMGSAFRLH